MIGEFFDDAKILNGKERIEALSQEIKKRTDAKNAKLIKVKLQPKSLSLSQESEILSSKRKAEVFSQEQSEEMRNLTQSNKFKRTKLSKDLTK